jgi:hypothetical protein
MMLARSAAICASEKKFCFLRIFFFGCVAGVPLSSFFS